MDLLEIMIIYEKITKLKLLYLTLETFSLVIIRNWNTFLLLILNYVTLQSHLFKANE